MGNRLLEVIKQVGIFMICAQMIVHFKPSEKYNKYIKLLVSIMVLVQLAVPVFGILGGIENNEFYGKVDFYNSFISDCMQEVNLTTENSEILLHDMTMEEVKTRLNNCQSEQPPEMNEEEKVGVTIQIGKIEVTADE